MDPPAAEQKKASVQDICKKIGNQVRKAQSLAGSVGEDAAFERVLAGLNKRAKALQNGLAKLPECNEGLKTGGDKLNASVFLFVEAARKVSSWGVFKRRVVLTRGCVVRRG